MEEKMQMFKHGPLYQRRFDIINDLKKIGLRTGDILYRASDAKGPFGLPFSRIVADVTKSKYSHAALVFIQNGEIFVFEVNDEGTLQYRLLDWLDTCLNGYFTIYRLKDMNDEKEYLIHKEIRNLLDQDPDYDFTFSDPDKFYCTESVVTVYERALGVKIDNGYLIKEIVPTWLYIVLCIGVPLFKLFGTSLPFNERLFFVGNEKKGMIASKLTECIYLATDI